MLGLTQQIGDKLKIEAFAIYNKAQVNPYRPLNYQQASSLSQHVDLDYNNNPSDYFYYGYNKNKSEDYNIFAHIEYAFDTHSTIMEHDISRKTDFKKNR